MDKAINASIRQRINDEYTYNYSVVRGSGNAVGVGDVVVVENQKFRVVETVLSGLGKNVLDVNCEHISYDLNVDMPLLAKDDDEGSDYVLNGVYSLGEAMLRCLEGTAFSVGVVEVNASKLLRYGKMTRRECLFKLAKDFNVELEFDSYTVNARVKIGSDKGAVFRYAHNLTGITKSQSKDGTGYRIDIVELGLIYDSYQNICLGDVITVRDETIGVDVRQRVEYIEYNPFRRIRTRVEIGNVEKDFIDEYLNDLQRVKDEMPKPDKIVYNQIVEVFKKEVISAQVIHSMTAWIDELEVNYLRTNFVDRMKNRGKDWNYIFIHDQIIEFNTAKLSATEYEQYKTASGRSIYYTAIGNHEDAYKYFTLTKPAIPENAVAVINGKEKRVEEKDFFVMVPKIEKQWTKLCINFELYTEFSTDGSGTQKDTPMIVWGAGNGSGVKGGKCFMYKSGSGFKMEYYRSDDDVIVVNLGDGDNRLRNVCVFDSAPSDLGSVNEGDVVMVRG